MSSDRTDRLVKEYAEKEVPLPPLADTHPQTAEKAKKDRIAIEKAVRFGVSLGSAEALTRREPPAENDSGHDFGGTK